MILQLEEVVAMYGFSRVLQGVSLAVEHGTVVALLGRNGAGKTTTLRSIMGLVRVVHGSIRFQQRELRSRQPFEVARLGIGYVPDDRRIFPDLTVEENLMLAARHSGRGRNGMWTLASVYGLFPPLRELRTRKGSYLSGGEQKMLAIGRALMGNPQLLMLDEPSEGLSPLIVRALIDALRRIKSEQVTILMADQNVKFARRLADRGYILEKGTIQHEGAMDALWQNEEILKKYLAV